MRTGAFLVAFITFPIPAVHPTGYWLWHSIWHLGCAVAFLELYTCCDIPQQGAEIGGNEKALAKPRNRAVNISVKTFGKAE